MSWTMPARVLCMSCLPCLFFRVFPTSTVDVGILQRSDISRARLFKGAPTNKDARQCWWQLWCDSPGDQTPQPLFVHALLLFTCTLPVLPVRASFFPTLTTWKACTRTHTQRYIHTDTQRHKPKDTPNIPRCTPKNTHTYAHNSVLQTDTHWHTYKHAHSHTHNYKICGCLRWRS